MKVQQHLSFKIKCSDQGLAESQSRTCDHRGDPHRANAGTSAAAEYSISFFSPAVVCKHPAQSAVQTMPGLPERHPPWLAQDCARVGIS